MAITLTDEMIAEIDNEVVYTNDGSITISHHVWFEYLNYELGMDCFIDNSRLTTWRALLDDAEDDDYEELCKLFTATIESKIDAPYAVFYPISEYYFDEEEEDYTLNNYDHVPVIINSYRMGRP